jgi:subtilisin family serine protease
MMDRIGRSASRWGALGLAVLMLSACGVTPAAPVLSPVEPAAVVQAATAPGGRLFVRRKTDGGMDGSRTAFEQKYRVTVKPHGLNVIGVDWVAVPPGVDVDALLARMQQDPTLEYAVKPNPVSLPTAIRRSQTGKYRTSGVGDPLRDVQYGLAQVEADKAWKATAAQAPVTIAIVDTGVDFGHPDLKDKLLPGYSTIAAQPSGRDDHGHGTHVAGIAAAMSDNGTGGSGMAPNAKLLPVKVLDANGKGDDADVAAGIVWAADHGASVINLSMVTDQASPLLRTAVEYAQGKHRAVIVAAMGNDGSSEKLYPAAFDGVIAVGASDMNDKPADFSNTGRWIAVTAPGVGIVSTFPTYSVTLSRAGFTPGYTTMDGTSMAAPFVSGLAALIKSQAMRQTPAQVKTAITKAAKDLGAKGFDESTGYGRIVAPKALSKSNATIIAMPVPAPSPSGYTAY